MRFAASGWKKVGPRSSWSRVFVSYGLLYSLILLLLVPAGTLVYGYAWASSIRFVFFVQLLTVDSLKRQNEPYSETIFLSVDGKERWTLQVNRVSPTEIPTMLTDLRGGRRNCVVFLDVDKDLPYSVAVQAIDSVQGTGFTVILLTPGTKKMRIP